MTFSLRKILKIGICTLVILFVYFSYFRYVDSGNNCSISIRPSIFEWNSKNVKEGLRALKYGYPEHYADVCRNVDKIVAAPSCGGWQGGCHYGKPGEIYLSTTHNEFVGWTAAIIVHETCHDIQLKEGRSFDESECYAAGHDTLIHIVQALP